MTGGYLRLLDSSTRNNMLALGKTTELGPGDELLSEGDPASDVLVVIRGLVKITVRREPRADLLVAVGGPGDVFGDIHAVDGMPSSTTVTAALPLTAMKIGAADFRTVLASSRAGALAFARSLSQRVRDAESERLMLLSHDSIARIARRLLELNELRGRARNGTPFALTQEELAGWAGVTRSTAARALRALRDSNCISTGRRSIVVRDAEALRRRAAGL
jgi:CRP-like cAMP-binding protein